MKQHRNDSLVDIKAPCDELFQLEQNNQVKDNRTNRFEQIAWTKPREREREDEFLTNH